jgi:hypothetical protein
MQEISIENKRKIETDELAKCYIQLKNSVARIYEVNDNVTPLSRMLDEMASRINMMRATRLKSK